ncbi:hypothetical protein FISHEDRAFT_57253 [Fistulina hepatica ATCC 64428]|nr:hypothetical protein FISHEDRAFT_57253 [Fistulina hepatica ATCC 64428]
MTVDDIGIPLEGRNTLDLMTSALWEPESIHQANIENHKADLPKCSTQCVTLNVVNKQKESKFKGMDITGVVNCQCSHICIRTSADTHLGEGYHIVNEAVACSLWDLKGNIPGNPLASLMKVYVDLSYNAACQYSVNWINCMRHEHPDLVNFA